MWVVWAGTGPGVARYSTACHHHPAAGCGAAPTEAGEARPNQLWQPAAASISAAQSLREGTMSKAGAVVGYI